MATTVGGMCVRSNQSFHENHFLQRFNGMLYDTERKGHSPIVSWDANGKLFMINPSGDLLVPIIGKHFFVRQSTKLFYDK